jgi:hypothetical protein
MFHRPFTPSQDDFERQWEQVPARERPLWPSSPAPGHADRGPLPRQPAPARGEHRSAPNADDIPSQALGATVRTTTLNTEIT